VLTKEILGYISILPPDQREYGVRVGYRSSEVEDVSVVWTALLLSFDYSGQMEERRMLWKRTVYIRRPSRWLSLLGCFFKDGHTDTTLAF
jgi:hypothetical protein